MNCRTSRMSILGRPEILRRQRLRKRYWQLPVGEGVHGDDLRHHAMGTFVSGMRRRWLAPPKLFLWSARCFRSSSKVISPEFSAESTELTFQTVLSPDGN